jgi:hypothetical protein
MHIKYVDAVNGIIVLNLINNNSVIKVELKLDMLDKRPALDNWMMLNIIK